MKNDVVKLVQDSKLKDSLVYEDLFRKSNTLVMLRNQKLMLRTKRSTLMSRNLNFNVEKLILMSDPSSFFPITNYSVSHSTARDRRYWSRYLHPFHSCFVSSSSDIGGEMFDVDDTVLTRSVQEIRSSRTNDTIRRDTKLECEYNTRKERDLTCSVRESWTWRCLQTVLKSVDSRSRWIEDRSLLSWKWI